MATKKGVPVSMRALVARINRKLHADGEILKTSRSARGEQELGHWYTIDFHNHLARGHIDPEELGREIGVLKEWERVVE